MEFMKEMKRYLLLLIFLFCFVSFLFFLFIICLHSFIQTRSLSERGKEGVRTRGKKNEENETKKDKTYHRTRGMMRRLLNEILKSGIFF